MTAVDFVRYTCDYDQKQAYNFIRDLIRRCSPEKIEKMNNILGKKTLVNGKADFQYILDHSQCALLALYLPQAKRAHGQDLVSGELEQIMNGKQSRDTGVNTNDTGVDTGNVDVDTGNVDVDTDNVDVDTDNVDVDTGNVDVDTGNADVDMSDLEQFAYKAPSDARATSNDAEAEMARSALSINRDEQLQSLERKRKLEELNIEMSEVALSKQKLEPPQKKLTCLFTLRQTVIQYPVDPKLLLFSLSPVCDCFEWPSDVPQQNDHCW